jgi:hypothetical protein
LRPRTEKGELLRAHPRMIVPRPRLPMIWGLSKSAASYRPATRPELRCAECKFMFPRLAIGGCRYVRGVIHAGDFCDEFVPRRGQRPPPGS